MNVSDIAVLLWTRARVWNKRVSRRALLQFESLKIRNDEFYVIQERRPTNFKAPKLGKGSSGFQASELR